ncbi:hypothetical protein SCFA_130003 [anaerobic digester metagenome]|uniref:Uncharacterized protein n=1 Tax=anaerobic digester metagenome TaxID=1263854 RepID=A0A485LVJ6_9ZZZZ
MVADRLLVTATIIHFSPVFASGNCRSQLGLCDGEERLEWAGVCYRRDWTGGASVLMLRAVRPGLLLGSRSSDSVHLISCPLPTKIYL